MRRSDLFLVVMWGIFCLWGARVVRADVVKPVSGSAPATVTAPVAVPVAAPVSVAAPVPVAAPVSVAAPASVPAPVSVAVPAPVASPAVKGPPSCSDMSSNIDGVPSVGAVKVPTTLDSENSYKDLDILKNINRTFTVEKIEKGVFDPKVDMPSQARMLVEYRCFGSWQRQHEFYRKVLRGHTCAYIRHRAAQMLEFDMCNVETVNALIAEYSRSIYPATRELIIRKLGMAHDKRALALVDDAIKSKSKSLAQSASEGKSYGQTQSCVTQDGTGKPYYGLTDIADVCEHTESEGGVMGNEAAPDPTIPADDPAPKGKSTGPKPGGAAGVDFNQ